MNKIGFIQGRLSPIINGMIQAFPEEHWKDEFEMASSNQFYDIEWTLDHNKLQSNPFITQSGQEEIQALKNKWGLRIPSLTGDFFMQAPFFKADDSEAKESLINELRLVIKSCRRVGTRFLVIPLVDNASLKTQEEEEECIKTLNKLTPLLEKSGVVIVFESDKSPVELKKFINNFPAQYFGINYDTGNSAALGYLPREEFDAYQERILNIHIKDRILGGTTVPLGEGNADFETIASCIKQANYNGNLILQTARDPNGKHLEALKKHRNFVMEMFE